METIVTTRRTSRITTAMLGAMRVPLARALAFVITADHTPRGRPTGLIEFPKPPERVQQLELFKLIVDG